MRIRREEEVPVHERLGDVHSLLVARTNVAITVAERVRPEDRLEILSLLQQVLTEAERPRLPEARDIRGCMEHIVGESDDGTAA